MVIFHSYVKLPEGIIRDMIIYVQKQALSKQDRSAGETRRIMYQQVRPDRWKWNETPTFFTAYSYSLTTSVHSLFGAYVFFLNPKCKDYRLSKSNDDTFDMQGVHC